MSLANRERDARVLYSACCWSPDYNIVRSQLEHGTDPDHQFYYTDTGNDRYGHTPLHWACFWDYVESARALIRYGADMECIDSSHGNTPLHTASLNGSTGAVQLLVEHNCNTDAKNYNGETPLDVAVRLNETKVVKLLKSHVHLPKDPLSVYPSVKQLCELPVDDIWFNLGLELGLHHDQLTAIQGNSENSAECKATMFLSVKRKVPVFTRDILVSAILKGESNLTLRSLAAQFKWQDVLECLSKKDCLLVASQSNQSYVVDCLLDDPHCDPNMKDRDGRTPLELTTDDKIIRSLLKHGARAADVYKTHRKAVGKLSSNRLPENRLPILITGKGGAGKSTFLKALLFVFSLLQRIGLFKVEPASNVDKKTVGIIPYLYDTNKFGHVAIYDFAGQEEFYASHSAVLQNALHTSPPIIIFCCNLLDSVADIMRTTTFWMNLIHNQCCALQDQAHVFVIGSHADLLGKGVDPRSKEGIFGPIIEKFPKFKFLAFVPMDCRLPDSAGMKEVRQHIEKSSALLRSPEVISLNAHTFHIYVQDNFMNEVAVSLEVVQSKLKIDLKQVQSKSKKDLLSFIPNTLPRVIEICSQLSQKGHILFLPNKSTPEQSYVVCNQQALLSHIAGTVYAPEGFRQHCELASSTGVVPLAKFADQFQKYDLQMLLAFVSHLELCFEVKDKVALEHIAKRSLKGASATRFGNRHLLFPGLIRIAIPDDVWEPRPHYKFYFGWMLKCTGTFQFFESRFLQILQLRLSLSLGLAPEVDEDVPSLQRSCFMWKSGICWCDDNGICCLVELVEQAKALVVQMRSEEITAEGLDLRCRVVNKVLEAAKKFCSGVDTVEAIIEPSQVKTHPLKPVSNLSMFKVEQVATAIIDCKPIVRSFTKPDATALKTIVVFEPYSTLSAEALKFLFHPCNPVLKEKVSKSFMAHLVNGVQDPESETLFCVMFSPRPVRGLSHTLEMWKSKTDGTYQCLRDTLDKYSIFGGRNPLDVAGVPHGDWDPSLLAAIEEQQQQPDSVTDIDLDSVDGSTILYDVGEVLTELSGLESDYFRLGLCLHLSPNKMKEIQENNPRNCGAALSNVIIEWLQMNYEHHKFGKPSWLLLVKSVHPVNSAQAKLIASRHAWKGEH